MLAIFDVIDSIKQSLIEGDTFLIAPPGAGKSTEVPKALLDLAIFKSKQIIVLQPRRVAARSIAHYLAKTLNENIGESVGYRIKGENKSSNKTRLLIVTEGVLSQMLLSDPEISNVACIVFDEFHERSIHSDFALALCKEVKQSLRPDLRLLLMSATLDESLVEHALPDARLIKSSGRKHEVKLEYFPLPKHERIEAHLVAVLSEVIEQTQGDILCFLPGIGSINLVSRLLTKTNFEHCDIHILHSSISPTKQDMAIKPCVDGKRKIILSTNIAETSLTIEGVSVVIDSGLEKYASFNFAKKALALNTQYISKASSVQRAGRAGRLAAGHCYRLWPQSQQARLTEHAVPEILRSDVSTLLLQTLEWGSKVTDLAMIDMPSEAQLKHAYENLSALGLVNSNGSITSLGVQANQFPFRLELRLLMIEAIKQKTELASQLILIIACLESTSLSQKAGTPELSACLGYLASNTKDNVWRDYQKLSRKYLSIQANSKKMVSIDQCLPFLLQSFLLKLGKKKKDNSYSLTNGTQVFLPDAKLVSPEWIICFDQLANQHNDTIVNTYLALAHSDLMPHIESMTTSQDTLVWNDEKQKIYNQRQTCLEQLVLKSEQAPFVYSEKSAEYLLSYISEEQFNKLLYQSKAKGLLMRLAFITQLDSKISDKIQSDILSIALQLSAKSLYQARSLHILPHITNCRSIQDLSSLDWQQIVKSLLSWEQSQLIEAVLPSYIELALGKSYPLEYTDDGQVILAAPMQVLYGMCSQPSILNGLVCVTLSILSPAKREIHKTKDIAAFWSGSYQEVKKEMKGRYPKHLWPDDPIGTKPTTRTKKFALD